MIQFFVDKVWFWFASFWASVILAAFSLYLNIKIDTTRIWVQKITLEGPCILVVCLGVLFILSVLCWAWIM